MMAAPTKRACESHNGDSNPSKLSSAEASDTKLKTFIQWCVSHQFNISAKVSVEKQRVCAQYGMVATDAIASGETLFSIPRPLLLTPDTSSIAELLQQGHAEIDSGWVPLLLALLYEYNSPQSPWRPYLDLVPDFSQLDLPMFWTRQEREKLLSGTGVEEAVTRDLELMEKDFKTVAMPFMQKRPDVFSPACRSFELYQRMVAFIMAYSFTEPAGKTEGDAAADEEDSDAEDPDSKPLVMMVPLADILNHVAKNNTRLTFHKDALRMISTQDIKKGEEVFNTYGELANKHLLHMYGFAEQYPLNHYDTVDIPVSVVTSAGESACAKSCTDSQIKDLMDNKLQFLEDQGLHQATEPYVLGAEGILTDDELQAALKVFAMAPDEFRDHVEKEGWSDAESDSDEDSSPLSFEKIPSLPLGWREMLSSIAKQCLSRLAGNETADEVTMDTENSQQDLSSRERYAFYVRDGQKRLLQQLVDACGCV